MKDYLKGYYKKQKDFNAKIEENNKRFSPDYAITENKKVIEQKAQAYEEAKAKINEIFNTAKTLLINANWVNVENLTADRLFFSADSGFDLTAEDVQAFVEKYHDNATMLRLIQDWITKHDTSTPEHPVGKYASVKIILPVDKLRAYKKFGEGALSVIEKIYNDSLIMIDPIELDTFADERFAKDLFDIVGNGMELGDYKSKKIPETAKHIFDDIVLTGANASYYRA